MNADTEVKITRRTMDIWPEGGAYLGLSRANMYKLVNEGKLPAVRVGRRWLLPIKALEDFLSCSASVKGQ